MAEFLNTSSAQAVIWGTVGLILVVVGFYVVRSLAENTGENTSDASELLSNFRELKEQGDISEAEFRTIKTVLGEPIKGPVADPIEVPFKDSGEVT